MQISINFNRLEIDIMKLWIILKEFESFCGMPDF